VALTVSVVVMVVAGLLQLRQIKPLNAMHSDRQY
jgi:hypothetical protein